MTIRVRIYPISGCEFAASALGVTTRGPSPLKAYHAFRDWLSQRYPHLMISVNTDGTLSLKR